MAERMDRSRSWPMTSVGTARRARSLVDAGPVRRDPGEKRGGHRDRLAEKKPRSEARLSGAVRRQTCGRFAGVEDRARPRPAACAARSAPTSAFGAMLAGAARRSRRAARAPAPRRGRAASPPAGARSRRPSRCRRHRPAQAEPVDERGDIVGEGGDREAVSGPAPSRRGRGTSSVSTPEPGIVREDLGDWPASPPSPCWKTTAGPRLRRRRRHAQCRRARRSHARRAGRACSSRARNAATPGASSAAQAVGDQRRRRSRSRAGSAR